MAECLFCRVVQRTIPASIVAETETLAAFKDINPQAPTHILIVPKQHIPTLADLSHGEASVAGDAMLFANRLAKEHGIAEHGYRVVVNCGAQAGQSVWHLHWHLLGGRPMRWPPG
jgi:histidine triad (HIT) family protein